MTDSIFPRLVLTKGREKSLLRRHPWIFSGGVARMEGKARSGETIDIVDHQGKWLARGAYSPSSQIRARVWTFDRNEAIDSAFFERRLQQAQTWRAWLAERDEDGAVVTFTGKVRNHNLGDSVKALTLEHYPGMTEKSLAEIVEQARERWPLGRVTVIHRIGEMWPGEEIVFVGVTSAHRGSAFAAGEFIMDYLKTRAPFWKREATPEGERWVDARDSDREAAERW